MNRILFIVGFLLSAALLCFSLSEGALNPMIFQEPAAALCCLLAGFGLVYVRRLAPLRERLNRARRDTSTKTYYRALFLFGVLFYATLSWVVFDALPHLDDDVVALFQARIFASGHLTIPLPARPEFFVQYFVLDPRFGFTHLSGMYPPAHAALLVPGVLLRMPWLVTPLFGGGLVVASAALARQLYGRRVGRLAGLFALFSPFLALLSSTYLSHVPTAFFCTLCMWSTCRLLRTRKWGFGALAGLALAVAFLSRPLTALVLGVVVSLGPLWYWRRWPRLWKGLLAALFTVACGVGLLLVWQKVTTGDYLTPGHKIGMGHRAKYGFGVIDWARTHTLATGIRYSALRLRALNTKGLGFLFPTYLVALLPFLLGRARKVDLWLVLPSLALLLAYCPYWYFEEYYPARYIFSGLPMLLVLAARGYDTLAKRMARARSPVVHRLPAALLAGSFCFQFAVFMPDYFGRFTPNHGDVESVLPRVVRDYGITNAVVFMDGTEALPDTNDPLNSFYATGFMRNNLAFDGDVVYAHNLREKNSQLAALYPGRTFYLYRYVRSLDKARLYRLTFEDEQQHITPVRPRTRDLTPPPP